MYENTQNLYQLCDLYVRKNKAKNVLLPEIQFFNEIWPIRKKSAHPWFIVTDWFIGSYAITSKYKWLQLLISTLFHMYLVCYDKSKLSSVSFYYSLIF